MKEPRTRKFFHFAETELKLMQLMNGQRTPVEIAEAAAADLRMRISAGSVADFAQKLKRHGLVERTSAEEHLMLFERLRSERRFRARRGTRGSILRLRFSIGDPDALFGRIVPRIRWAWSFAFVAVSLLLFVTYGAIVGSRWDEFWAGAKGLYTLSGFGFGDWMLLYGLFLITGAVHELGHGLTTKHYGGEVHEIGAMMLYFSPALFCNTSDAWAFEKRGHRLWVTFAGPWIELVVAALAAIAWVITEPGTFVHRAAFLSVLLGGVSAFLADLNPLLPLDGYYALSDWLELPNLRRRAFDYWGWLVKRFLLGLNVAEPPVTPRERRILVAYGALALLYSALVLAISLLWLVLVLGRFIGPWAYVVLGIIGVRLIDRHQNRVRALARAAVSTWAPVLRRNRRLGLGAMTLAFAAGLTLLLPWTFRARGDVRVEAADRFLVRTAVEGLIENIYVGEGDSVRAGTILAKLWNPAVESTFVQLTAETERLRRIHGRASASGDLARAASASAALDEVGEALALAAERRRSLILEAPMDGIVLGDRLRERIGSRVASGEAVMEVLSAEGRIARGRFPLKDAGDLRPGQRATLKFASRPSLKFRSTVSRVSVTADAGSLEVEIPLPVGDWQPAPGTTGVAKIETGRGRVVEAVARSLRQTIRIDLWL